MNKRAAEAHLPSASFRLHKMRQEVDTLLDVIRTPI